MRENISVAPFMTPLKEGGTCRTTERSSYSFPTEDAKEKEKSLWVFNIIFIKLRIVTEKGTKMDNNQ